MKLKFLLFISTFCFASFSCWAQEKSTAIPVDVRVSIKESKISFYAKSIPVDVKITNNLLAGVNTNQFDKVGVYLSKTLDGKTIDKTEMSFFEFEPKALNIGESLETQIDLNKLPWLENPSSSDAGNFRNKYKPLFFGKYFLSVAVGNCESVLPENSLLTVTRRPCESNKILIEFLATANSR